MKKIFTLLIFSFSAFFTFAQAISETAILLPEERRNNQDDHFGQSVAAVEGFAVIGAPDASDHGRVYMYHKVAGNWTYLAELIGTNLPEEGMFGYQVAMDSNTVFVASNSPTSSRPIYVFEKPASGWVDMTQTALLHASDSSVNDQFGRAMEVVDNHLFVGAPGAINAGQEMGAVYVFEKSGSTWISGTESRKIISPNPNVNDEFGFDLAVHNNQLLIGAPNDLSSSNKGKAYLLTFNGTWTQGTYSTVELLASNGLIGDRFGHALDITAEDIVVGAPFYDGPSTNTGMGYQFSRPITGWANATESTLLSPPVLNGAYQRKYAEVVELRDDAVFFGVPNEGLYDGAVFIHRKDNMLWSSTPNADLNNDAGTFYDFLGEGFAALENEVLAGMPGDDQINKNEGTLNVFTKVNATWDNFYTQERITAPANMGFEEETFGSAVDIENNIAVIGAPSHNEVGIVYVREFDGTQWNNIAILSPSDSTEDLGFGLHVKIAGDWIAVVGDRHDAASTGHITAANIYMFKKPVNGWTSTTETAKIPFGGTHSTAYDIEAFDFDGEVMVATDVQQKIAFVYEKGSGDWSSSHTPIAELTTPITSSLGFGHAVAIDNDVIVVSDPYLQATGSNDEQGKVYVYEKPATGWTDMTETAELTFSEGGFRMGISLDIENDLIIVGCPYYIPQNQSFSAGSGLVFQRQGANWTNQNELARLDIQARTGSDRLGWSVAVENGIIFMGAPRYYTGSGSESAGVVAVFDKGSQTTWTDMYELGLVNARPINTYGPTGFNLAVDGSNILAGAPLHDSIGENTGLVYHFNACYDIMESEVSACNSYTWIDGITYTETPSEILTFTVPNAQGCDSILRLDLTINNVGASTTYSNEVLSAFPLDLEYALLDCDDNFAVLSPFSTNNQFPINSTGNYAVIVRDSVCSDTTECKGVFISDLNVESLDVNEISIHPNPSNGVIQIRTSQHLIDRIEIYDATGNAVLSKKAGLTAEFELQTNVAPGIYWINIVLENGERTMLKHIVQ